ncbi:translation initiation factor eIF3 subunit g [Tulasnella sp. JGI-2019a]|nr:translation initiation factor eIF3 subunit g [Tulasnella sp. JGI-2019a]
MFCDGQYDKGRSLGSGMAVTDAVNLEFAAGRQQVNPKLGQGKGIEKRLEGKEIQCQLCKAVHSAAKCPYNDSLGLVAADMLGDYMSPTDNLASLALSGGKGGTAIGKYVPPSTRTGASASNRAGETMYRKPPIRDDIPTLRVTNVSGGTRDGDLKYLFKRFGRVTRVYVGRDRKTRIGKGYAFVAFEDKAIAETALEEVHGTVFDGRTLNVQWAQPKEQQLDVI